MIAGGLVLRPSQGLVILQIRKPALFGAETNPFRKHAREEQRVIANVLGSGSGSVSTSDEPLKISPLLSLFVKLPLIGTLPARLIAFGPVPVHLKVSPSE